MSTFAAKHQLVHHISTFQHHISKCPKCSLKLPNHRNWTKTVNQVGCCNRSKKTSAKSTESQEFLHTCSRKVTIKPTSIPPTGNIKNALCVHDSNENEVSSNAHCIRNTQRQQNEMRPQNWKVLKHSATTVRNLSVSTARMKGQVEPAKSKNGARMCCKAAHLLAVTKGSV